MRTEVVPVSRARHARCRSETPRGPGTRRASPAGGRGGKPPAVPRGPPRDAAELIRCPPHTPRLRPGARWERIFPRRSVHTVLFLFAVKGHEHEPCFFSFREKTGMFVVLRAADHGEGGGDLRTRTPPRMQPRVRERARELTRAHTCSRSSAGSAGGRAAQQAPHRQQHRAAFKCRIACCLSERLQPSTADGVPGP